MNADDSLLILTGPDIHRVLDGREQDIIDAVAEAYRRHRGGQSYLPQSVFVRFPGRKKERIIALPGYLGGDDEVAGIKWISSFPANLERGMSRASAILVLNSLTSGRPEAVLESSIVSAARTAASAALAADVLHGGGDVDILGVIGCGVINREIVRFIASRRRIAGSVMAYDIDGVRAEAFGRTLSPIIGEVPFTVAPTVETVLARASIVSFATTAIDPTIADLSMCRPSAIILHVSLRDLTADAILYADNVVDDIDHVMRAETSVHLAERKTGHRDFVRCTLADILNGDEPPRRDVGGVVVFSPFGLGVLDLAVGRLALKRARAEGVGTTIASFFEGT